MKKSELKFKVATITAGRAVKVLDALSEAGMQCSCGAGSPDYLLIDGNSVRVMSLVDFIDADVPEVTYLQALDLIAQVEPEPKTDGEFVELDVDAAGLFYARWGDSSGQKTYWSNVVEVERHSGMELVFAGWQWKGEDGFLLSTRRQGFDFKGKLTAEEFAWKKPAQPVAVRFWRPNSVK